MKINKFLEKLNESDIGEYDDDGDNEIDGAEAESRNYYVIYDEDLEREYDEEHEMGGGHVRDYEGSGPWAVIEKEGRYARLFTSRKQAMKVFNSLD